jgi:DNA polymerase III delta prime subunit
MLGDAKAYGLQLWRKTDSMAGDPKAFFRAMFYGAVGGTGKSELAQMLGHKLANHHLAVEIHNGQGVSVDLVRNWKERACYCSMFGSGWTVKIIDEFERMSEAAQFELRQILDLRHPMSCYILTTNVDLKEIPQPFHTRAMPYRFRGIPEAELADWLTKKWGLTPDKARRVVAANKNENNGCSVRGALFDAERELDNT